jgi:biotin carboxyl carrier protein
MALHEVPSPMTGTVKEVLVSPGESVTAGQELLIVESMKMELPIEAERAGTITEVLVEPGQRIEEGHPLLRVEG